LGRPLTLGIIVDWLAGERPTGRRQPPPPQATESFIGLLRVRSRARVAGTFKLDCETVEVAAPSRLGGVGDSGVGCEAAVGEAAAGCRGHGLEFDTETVEPGGTGGSLSLPSPVKTRRSSG